jgi:hypothetical protein
MFEFFLSKFSLTDVTDVTETRTKTILATVIVKWASKKRLVILIEKLDLQESTRNKKLQIYKELLKTLIKSKKTYKKPL